MKTREIFCARLKECRLNKKKTQDEMSSYFGLSPVAYGAWERGQNEPSMENLVKLCEFFSVSSDWLLGLDKGNDQFSGRLNAMKTEAEQAAATLNRLMEKMKEMEMGV